MKKYCFSQRAHSIVEWVIIFSLIPLVFLVVQSSFKRILQGKVQALTDNVIWTRWGNETQQYGRGTNVRSISRQQSSQDFSGQEYHQGRQSSEARMSASQQEVSVAVEEGAEDRLNATNLSALGGF